MVYDWTLKHVGLISLYCSQQICPDPNQWAPLLKRTVTAVTFRAARSMQCQLPLKFLMTGGLKNVSASPGINQCRYLRFSLTHGSKYGLFIKRSYSDVYKLLWSSRFYANGRGKRTLAILSCPVIMHADTNFPRGRTVCARLSSSCRDNGGANIHTQTHLHSKPEKKSCPPGISPSVHRKTSL